MLAVLVAASGAALVAAEVLWARDWALVLGSTAEGTAVVLAATFGGLAAGAAIGGRLRGGLAAYARIEAGLALALVGYVVLRPSLAPLVVGLEAGAPEPWRMLVRVGCPLAVLLAPTLLAGATMPVVAATRDVRDARGLGALYAWNTLGGAAGALAVPFVLLGTLGMRGSYVAIAAVDAAVAGVAGWLGRGVPDAHRSAPATAVSASGAWRPAVLAAMAGFVGLAGEVLWTRALAGSLSNSVYSFAIVLAVVLLGIVAGAAIATRLLSRWPAEPVLAWTFAALGVAVACSVEPLGAVGAALGARPATSLGGGLAGEVALATSVVLASAILLGTVFPATLALVRGGTASAAMGRVLAANTLGGMAGSIAAAFVFLPRLGLERSLWRLAPLAFLASALAARRRMRWAALGLAVATTIVADTATFAPWRSGVPPSERIVLEREGAAATVTVGEDANGARRLRVNGRYSLGGTDGLLLEEREAHVPMLLHPHPRTVLHVGVGTGDTMGAELAHPGVEADGVELLPEVLTAAQAFAATNGDLLANPRAHLVADDVRSFLLRTDRRYDVIVADLFLPWTAGASALYSREFYALAENHLAPGGLVCQWLPLHQLAVGDLEAVVATFVRAFPDVELWSAYYRTSTPLVGLVGRREPVAVDATALAARMSDPALAPALREVGLVGPRDLAVLYVTDGRRLATATADALPISDDRPRLDLTAPAAYFRQHELAREDLAWVAARLDPGPGPIAGASASAELRALLLTAQMALLAGRPQDETTAYLRAYAIAPGLPTVDMALRAIASSRRAAGDRATASLIERTLGRAFAE
ncbi:MAG TPA: fused MFS/spermidine synthase [Candidatus Eisenbacteria bacterium]|nr:fused MFS/spermidine synthase [Candidatus Eisenbacteria bacterium]